MKKAKFLLILTLSIIIIFINKNKQIEGIKIITNDEIQTCINLKIDNNFYNNINEIKEPNNIDVLVNKNNKLSNSYIPADLTKINTKYATKNQYLRKEAHNAFIIMLKDALKENIHIYAGSTYRSYQYQEWLYNKYVIDYTIDIADKFSARPGHSEHQTGLAVDILNKNFNYLNESDIEYSWLINNSYKYGFILRYPKGKENITGYMYEPWHFRYLDTFITKILYDNNLTYEEYIDKNKQN